MEWTQAKVKERFGERGCEKHPIYLHSYRGFTLYKGGELYGVRYETMGGPAGEA